MKETLPSYEAMMPAVLRPADGVAALLAGIQAGHAFHTRHSAPDFLL